MTYSRLVAILCFVVIMLITALTPLGLETSATVVRGGRMTATVAAPRVPATGWNRTQLRRP